MRLQGSLGRSPTLSLLLSFSKKVVLKIKQLKVMDVYAWGARFDWAGYIIGARFQWNCSDLKVNNTDFKPMKKSSLAQLEVIFGSELCNFLKWLFKK